MYCRENHCFGGYSTRRSLLACALCTKVFVFPVEKKAVVHLSTAPKNAFSRRLCIQYVVHIRLECAPGAYMRIVGVRKFPRLFTKGNTRLSMFLVGPTVKPHSFLFLSTAHGSKSHSSILLSKTFFWVANSRVLSGRPGRGCCSKGRRLASNFGKASLRGRRRWWKEARTGVGLSRCLAGIKGEINFSFFWNKRITASLYSKVAGNIWGKIIVSRAFIQSFLGRKWRGIFEQSDTFSYGLFVLRKQALFAPTFCNFSFILRESFSTLLDTFCLEAKRSPSPRWSAAGEEGEFFPVKPNLLPTYWYKREKGWERVQKKVFCGTHENGSSAAAAAAAAPHSQSRLFNLWYGPPPSDGRKLSPIVFYLLGGLYLFL